MKVVFYVSTSIVLFVFVFSFVVQNPHDITIHYYFGVIWDGPIVTLLLLTLGVGMLFGLFVSSLGLLKAKTRMRKVAKELRSVQSNQLLRSEQLKKEGN